MRWGGLALADAVQFELSSLKNGSGHVTYRRVKTNTEAEPTLPTRVVVLLREVVPIDADPNRPFYDKDIKTESNRGNWSLRIKDVFAEAGITSVETPLRDREPHAHMLRDTFAVGQMRTQKKLGIVDVDGIAKAMGDSAAMVRKHYAPWVKELDDAHREMQQCRCSGSRGSCQAAAAAQSSQHRGGAEMSIIPFIDIDALPPKEREKLLLSETEIDGPYEDAEGDTKVSAVDFYSWPNGKFWKQRRRKPTQGGYIPANAAAKLVGWSRGLLVRHVRNNVTEMKPEYGVIERKRRRRTTVWFSKALLTRLFPDSIKK